MSAKVVSILNDGRTMNLWRTPPPPIMAQRVLHVSQRLAFAKGAMSLRLGQDSPMYWFAIDACTDMFDRHSAVFAAGLPVHGGAIS